MTYSEAAMSIPKNIQALQQQIRLLAKRPIELVAVTKNHSIDEIKQVVEGGITDIAENRWQEAQGKLPDLPTGITKHFIGRIQSNKVRPIVENFDLIQSVDRLKIARKINEVCLELNKTQSILVQINTSDEDQKAGIRPSEVEGFLQALASLPAIKTKGLMTIGPLTNDTKKIRQSFRQLNKLQKILLPKYPNLKTLSMGMSQDYEIAIEEGTTMVRIGSKIFA